MHQRHQFSDHAGVGSWQHAVAEIENVAGGSRVDRAAGVLDDGPCRPLDDRPARKQNDRIEIALKRRVGRYPGRRVGQRRAPVDADDSRAPADTASAIAPSNSAVPTPKWVIGTPASFSDENTRELCGST